MGGIHSFKTKAKILRFFWPFGVAAASQVSGILRPGHRISAVPARMMARMWQIPFPTAKQKGHRSKYKSSGPAPLDMPLIDMN